MAEKTYTLDVSEKSGDLESGLIIAALVKNGNERLESRIGRFFSAASLRGLPRAKLNIVYPSEKIEGEIIIDIQSDGINYGRRMGRWADFVNKDKMGVSVRIRSQSFGLYANRNKTFQFKVDSVLPLTPSQEAAQDAVIKSYLKRLKRAVYYP